MNFPRKFVLVNILLVFIIIILKILFESYLEEVSFREQCNICFDFLHSFNLLVGLYVTWFVFKLFGVLHYIVVAPWLSTRVKDDWLFNAPPKHWYQSLTTIIMIGGTVTVGTLWWSTQPVLTLMNVSKADISNIEIEAHHTNEFLGKYVKFYESDELQAGLSERFYLAHFSEKGDIRFRYLSSGGESVCFVLERPRCRWKNFDIYIRGKEDVEAVVPTSCTPSYGGEDIIKVHSCGRYSPDVVVTR